VTDSTQQRIDRYLGERSLPGEVTKVVPLTGDASDRRYFRVLIRGGDSIVLALHTGAIDFEKMPFVGVARLLSRVPLPVPEILHYSNEMGIIALQDLGDVTLQAHLGAAYPDEHDARYREAVAFIVRMQQRGAELASDEYPPYKIAFDTDKLSWELEFFYKYFLKAYRGATMGPDTYDLASLLRDSYVDLTSRQVDELFAYFLALKAPVAGVSQAEAAEFRRRFDLMALQRNFKARGTFGYQTVTRSNAVYIQYMPRTLNYLRRNLTKYPRFGRLQELLAPLIEELR
jgi:aminoglycoside/choline kinase family phosphotransferase